MLKDRNICVLYVSSVCNLNCNYCTIDKNPALRDIDKILQESFEGNYYLDMISKMFPDPNQLEQLEFWGSESTLHMERVNVLINELIPLYPNLNKFSISTNMAFHGWCDKFLNFTSQFHKFRPKTFSVNLQISLDGSETITDFSRGAGTYQMIINNFNELIRRLSNEFPANVTLYIKFKPTLDATVFKKIKTDDDVIAYYKPADELVEKIIKLNCANIKIYPMAPPNFAIPCPSTIQDGRDFAEFVKRTLNVEMQFRNGLRNDLKHHRIFTPFSVSNLKGMKLKETIISKGYTCGSGVHMLGILPYGMISTCHSGFIEVLEEYRNLVKNPNNEYKTIDNNTFLAQTENNMMMNISDFEKYEYHMSLYHKEKTSARLATIVTQIRVLAEMGHIDNSYRNAKESIRAGIWYQDRTAYCVRENKDMTGSITTIHNGMIKLLFNGAHRLIEQEDRIEWVH